MIWNHRTFSELSTTELYEIIVLRERVFVVEQACVFLEADGLDPASTHLWAADADRIIAYLRIIPAGLAFEEVSIGRVVVAPDRRAGGFGRELMQRGIAAAGGVAIRIGAQAHLERFYGEVGFRRASEPYIEDGIPHIQMLRA